jgi:hypothetical protein
VGYYFPRVSVSTMRSGKCDLSIGMSVLKDYVVIFNFPKSYMALQHL